MAKLVKRLINSLLEQKEIVIISSSKIKKKRVGFGHKCLNLLFGIWVCFSTCFVFCSIKTFNAKDLKIKHLAEINTNLDNDLKSVNIILGNMKEYFATLNYYDRFKKMDVAKISNENNLLLNQQLMTENEYIKVLPVINSIDRDVKAINSLLDNRIDGIKSIIETSPELSKKTAQIYKVNYSNIDLVKNDSGLIPISSELLRKQEFLNIKEKIQYLNFLESFLNTIPISKPMNNYYLTSKFGLRTDPFTKTMKNHRGLDMAGNFGASVLATSDGVVEKVSSSKGFGNAVIVNHGNEIKTIYAHLKQSVVKVGDKVKRGDQVGVQGNSGRSTGPHLHYEIKINNVSVNPLNFVKMGERIY